MYCINTSDSFCGVAVLQLGHFSSSSTNNLLWNVNHNYAKKEQFRNLAGSHSLVRLNGLPSSHQSGVQSIGLVEGFK